VVDPDIDDAGTGVWFRSNASNLDPADTTANIDVFRYDTATGAIAVVSLSDAGTQVTGTVTAGPAVSGTGAQAAFVSNANTLVPADTNGRDDVFVRTEQAVCTADFNQSGAVDVFDILDYLTAWNAMDPAANLDGDGSFTIFDVLDFLARWSTGCP
jgi:hypothetical protein